MVGSRRRFLSRLLGALVLCVPAAACAQHAGHEGHDAAGEGEAVSERTSQQGMTDPAMAAMTMAPNPHMRMTPARAATAEDRRRAAEVEATLRGAIAKYRDVKVAEADGYRMFLPGVKNQPVYHFTSNWRGAKAAFRFDPAQPTSLLYERDSSGALTLVGAMYTAPKRASLDDLDARVPLSVARWHKHVDICLPPRGARERWAEKGADGRMRFGPAGSIATREACDAVGGRFVPELFGWMVPANVYRRDVWGVGHEGHAGH
jgi:hypothetical protein